MLKYIYDNFDGKINLSFGMTAQEKRDDCLVFELENTKIDGAAHNFIRDGIVRTNIDWKNNLIL